MLYLVPFFKGLGITRPDHMLLRRHAVYLVCSEMGALGVQSKRLSVVLAPRWYTNPAGGMVNTRPS